MLDIVGNIKVDESKPERVDYFIACLKSWQFFKAHCKIILSLESPSDHLMKLVKRTIEECGYNAHISKTTHPTNYGLHYSHLLNIGDNPFIINFIEDHFTIMDDKDWMIGLLNTMKKTGADVCLSSFFKIEKNSSHTLKNPIISDYGKIFYKGVENHKEYCRHYESRYYLGVNFITTRPFALKFWNRDNGTRPHDYEIAGHDPKWEHYFMIPDKEIQCAVDDDHGEAGTCMLNRKDPKWVLTFKPGISKIPNSEKEIIQQEAICEVKPYIPAPLFTFNDLKEENTIFISDIEFRWNKIFKSAVYLLGSECTEMEERFSKLIGKKYCVAVKNGTDALMLAIQYALTQKPAAHIIVPNFGAYPTAIAAANLTDQIHFVDVDESLTIDVKKLPADIKNGIIIPVHLFGNNCNMKIIKRYADQNNHIIIEDCAQSTGSGSGQVGDLSIFSFYPTKPLGTMGDGGAILTNDKKAYEWLLSMRFYGIKDGIIHQAGVNSRMGELECAIVNAKIDKFEQLIEKRRTIVNRYKKIVDGIRINSNCIYHQFAVMFNEREKIIAELDKQKIPFMIHYPEHISDMPAFKHLKHKVGFKVNDKIISLPCHPFMHEEHIQKVESFLKEHKKYEY